jgi:hypothetical protein
MGRWGLAGCELDTKLKEVGKRKAILCQGGTRAVHFYSVSSN